MKTQPKARTKAASKPGPKTKRTAAPKAAPALPTQTLLHIMAQTRVEAVAPSAAVQKAMAAQQKRTAGEPEQSTGGLPKWVQTLVKQNADPSAIIAAAVARGLAKGDRATLMEVRTVLNEFGRNRDNAAEVVQSLTVGTLNKLRK